MEISGLDIKDSLNEIQITKCRITTIFPIKKQKNFDQKAIDYHLFSLCKIEEYGPKNLTTRNCFPSFYYAGIDEKLYLGYVQSVFTIFDENCKIIRLPKSTVDASKKSKLERVKNFLPVNRIAAVFQGSVNQED